MTAIEELPVFWQKQIRALRAENQKMRQERNEARVLLAEMTLKVAPQILSQ